MHTYNAIPRCVAFSELAELSDGAVVRQGDMVHTLNPTGAEVLKLCDGERTVQDILDEMAARHPGGDTAGPVGDFLDQLSASGLIEW